MKILVPMVAFIVCAEFSDTPQKFQFLTYFRGVMGYGYLSTDSTFLGHPAVCTMQTIELSAYKDLCGQASQ